MEIDARLESTIRDFGKNVGEFEGDVCVLYIPLLTLRQCDKTKNLEIAYLLISDISCTLGWLNVDG